MKSMSRFTNAIIVLVSIIALTSCVTGPSQFTGKVGLEKMFGLIPKEADAYLYIDFSKVDWSNPVIEKIMSKLMIRIDRVLKDSDFDVRTKLYSAVIGINVGQNNSSDFAAYLVINYSYPKEKLLQNLVDAGFTENENKSSRYVRELYADSIGVSDKPITIFAIGESILVLAVGGDTVALKQGIYSGNKIDSSFRRIESVFKLVKDDTIALGIIPATGAFLNGVGADKKKNLALRFVGPGDLAAIKIDEQKEGFAFEGFISVDDENRRDQLYGIVSLALEMAKFDKDQNRDVLEIMKTVSIDKIPGAITMKADVKNEIFFKLIENLLKQVNTD
jgi:hypothetical protein